MCQVVSTTSSSVTTMKKPTIPVKAAGPNKNKKRFLPTPRLAPKSTPSRMSADLDFDMSIERTNAPPSILLPHFSQLIPRFPPSPRDSITKPTFVGASSPLLTFYENDMSITVTPRRTTARCSNSMTLSPPPLCVDEIYENDNVCCAASTPQIWAEPLLLPFLE